MEIEILVAETKLSTEEMKKLSRFAFWKVPQEYAKNGECGSCSSFCSGGACTTCTGAMNEGYLTAKPKYD